MKTSRIWTLSLCAFFFASASIYGQQSISEPATVKKTVSLKIDKSNVKVQRHTVMSRFEPEIASTEEKRLEKRHNRIAETERKLSIIDTLDISKRRKKALLRDLEYTPFSDRLNKATLVDTKFEESTENQDNL
ncbi:hypothetical protein FEE95_12325 [Maribacter algarum]|uniref:Uncharacterized protein n=1 Tax=Maribacter algarum (ex Zhang et al. 2020) TaxID=2578118 RepID=A0A5S3PR91_9FLAO|nr:hypothetical protein [Maribacter algarum]TMM57266.1 hypothetical protein FEE95_12325 [Maribacter algarum]